jgi:chaperonin cofactor prefoldin
MSDVRFAPPQDAARAAFGSHQARSKTHHGGGDRQHDLSHQQQLPHPGSSSGLKAQPKEFVSVRLPELPGAVQERFNALKMTRSGGTFGPRLTVLDQMSMKQRLMEEHVQHLVEEFNNVKAAADAKVVQLDALNAQVNSASDVCGEITELSSNMEVYMTALQQRCDIVCTRLEDTHTHQDCLRMNAERLTSSNRAIKVRTDAIKSEIAKGDAKFKEARRLHHVMGKASLAAQDDFQRARSLLLAEADERQAQLDHRMSIWQFQQQQQNADDAALAAEEQSRARAALTTASSVATAGEEGPDAAVELEQMLVARAPLQEQLKWDRQQSNTVAAGMARLEVCVCARVRMTCVCVRNFVGHRARSAAPGQTPSSSGTTPANIV